MNRPQRALALLTLTTAVISTSQCAYPNALVSSRVGQDVPTGTVGVRNVPSPKLEGKAEGRLAPFKYEGQDLRDAVLAHPAPEVWLRFPATEGKDPAPSDDGTERAVRVELPPEAQRLINSQWSGRLASEYDWHYGEVANAQERVNLSVRMAQVSQQTALQLREVFIEAPDGRRPLSMNEANSVAQFINQSVAKVIEQAKASKGQR
jgi:hypothetical protein